VLGRFLPAEAAAVRARVGIDQATPSHGGRLVLLDLTDLTYGDELPGDLTDGVRHLAAAGSAVLVTAQPETAAALNARLGDLVECCPRLAPDDEEVLL
jgi:hypothetical protein